MPRWEPDARERLVLAALELFTGKGYDDTSVVEIAERAGLTKSTFFRHFSDKREVLFVGQDILHRLLAGGIAAAPASATPLEAVGSALEAASAGFPPERQAFARRRQAVVTANSELQEREALKRGGLTWAMAQALGQRGVEEPAASLAAEVGMLAFRTAFARWIEPGNAQAFAVLARESLDALQAAGAALTTGTLAS
jgi:AcrR family transcriptional regulator